MSDGWLGDKKVARGTPGHRLRSADGDASCVASCTVRKAGFSR